MLGDDQNLQTVKDKLVHAGGMRKLGVDGTKVKIFLSTFEKKNSPLDSYLIRDLMVSDVDQSHFVHLPTLYTRPEIPVPSQ